MVVQALAGGPRSACLDHGFPAASLVHSSLVSRTGTSPSSTVAQSCGTQCEGRRQVPCPVESTVVLCIFPSLASSSGDCELSYCLDASCFLSRSSTCFSGVIGTPPGESRRQRESLGGFWHRGRNATGKAGTEKGVAGQARIRKGLLALLGDVHKMVCSR